MAIVVFIFTRGSASPDTKFHEKKYSEFGGSRPLVREEIENAQT
jgi:hypothetical protein